MKSEDTVITALIIAVASIIFTIIYAIYSYNKTGLQLSKHYASKGLEQCRGTNYIEPIWVKDCKSYIQNNGR